ncbi:MAG TPA: aminotransferase class I/II-fold pyridoxal phosphate-dependent enzyme [Chitinophagaceae bacterium]|nr:aminotransferase class I/II-fold pyridoxal phosphate-dependent enzyme [Chitinophagaceae bacterium]
MPQSIHRRAWLRQSSLAIAGFTFAGKISANAHEYRRENFLPTGPIRLTSNENPYGPSPLARKAMADAIALSNRYPWDTTTVLRGQIGSLYGLSTDHVLMGAGSSEILGLVAQYAALAKGNAITATPAFQIWVPAAEKLGLEIIRVPLTRDKKHDLPAMMSKLNNSTRLMYVCNPNNPTGTVLPSANVKNFVEEASRKCLVLLDEAYIEYCDQPTLAGLVASNKNIVIAKTFSKIHGLAGARIGYALAHPDTIRQLAALQPWQNAGASAVSLAAAIASLQDKEFLRTSKESNKQAGNYTQQALQSMGFECIPSNTNFLYYSVKSFNGNWPELLRGKNILTGRIVEEEGKWTRTTIGTMEEMQAFVASAKQLV